MQLQLLFTWLWLLAFANAIAPKSFLHAFHEHQETCDNVASHETIATQHTHCDLLKFELSISEGFVASINFYYAVTSYYKHVSFDGFICLQLPSSEHLRGPPVAR